MKLTKEEIDFQLENKKEGKEKKGVQSREKMIGTVNRDEINELGKRDKKRGEGENKSYGTLVNLPTENFIEKRICFSLNSYYFCFLCQHSDVRRILLRLAGQIVHPSNMSYITSQQQQCLPGPLSENTSYFRCIHIIQFYNWLQISNKIINSA